MNRDRVNIWIGFRNDLLSEILAHHRYWAGVDAIDSSQLNAGEKKFLNRIWARESFNSSRFRSYTVAGHKWTLFSLYGLKPSEAQTMAAAYPAACKIAGAWDMDTGLQLGTSRDPATGEVIGAPLAPIPAITIEFMQDIVVYDEEGIEVSRVRPTTLTDLILVLGQAGRDFS